MNRWVDNASVGPFFLLPRTRLQNALCNGQPVEVEVDIACAQTGRMQIELIAPLQEPGPIFGAGVRHDDAALHHVAAYTDDLHSEISHYSRLGLDIVLRASHRGTNFIYVDTRSTLGCMTELIERRGALPIVFDSISRLSAEWDGTVPMRYDFAESWPKGPAADFCPNPSVFERHRDERKLRGGST
jgi:hypothetical protein